VDEAALPATPEPAARPGTGFLASAWAEVLGVDHVDLGANYWQSFAFIDVLAEAHASGLPIANRHVTRNRTLETLVTDLAASRTGGPPPSETD
jgi:hypothetical protein